jgi:hypothetical protein
VPRFTPAPVFDASMTAGVRSLFDRIHRIATDDQD